ncbi:MAG: HAD hydrolase-like protein [Nitrososphaerota archaeon]|nr:HAD hydrolase-like protein [Nitrososphaerota archaeon]
MQAKALLFNIGVLAEIDIDYLPASQFLGNTSSPILSQMRNIIKQLHEMGEKLSEEEYQDWFDKVSNTLDEIETAQISKFHLHMGVKNGLDSLQSTGLPIYVLTDMGEKACKLFLTQHDLGHYVNSIISRNDANEIGNIAKSLDIASKKLELIPERCIYFCNRLSELKEAKSAKFRTIILPSRKERINDLIAEGSDGMIVSLEEIPSLLSLDTFKESPEEKLEKERAENPDGTKEDRIVPSNETELESAE